MKTLKIALIILLVVLVAIPLFGGRRGRRTKRMARAPLTLSLFGGAEDLTGEVNEDMYWSFGCNAIIRLVEPFMYRFGLANIKLYKDSNVMAFGTGVGGDIMYYWQVPMAFAPYGFGGLWFFNYSYDSDLIPNSSILTIRLGVGGEMVAMYNLFLEGGLDFQQVSDDGSSDSVTPFFIRGGVRFPLLR